MRSAKQKGNYRADLQYDFNDINAELVDNIVIESPYAGWINQITVEIEADDISHDCGMGIIVSDSDEWGRVGSSVPVYKEVMNAWDTDDRAGSVMAETIPEYFVLPSGAVIPDNTSAVIKKVIRRFIPVQAGNDLNLQIFFNDFTNTLTSGTVSIRVHFDFIPAALDYYHQELPDVGNSARVAILATMDDDAQQLFWTPPCKGKVGSVRMTVWGDMSNYRQRVYFTNSMHTDSQGAGAELVAKSDQYIEINNYNRGTADIEPMYCSTVYTQDFGIIDVGEFLQLAFESDITSDVRILVEFEFIPFNDAEVSFAWNGQQNTISGTPQLHTWRLPFDVYVDQIDFDYFFSIFSGHSGFMYILQFHDIPEGFTQNTVITGSILGANGIEDNMRAVLPANTIKSFAVKSDIEPIIMHPNDRIPGGSNIALVIDLASAPGTESVAWTFNLKGFARVSPAVKFGQNYLHGDGIEQYEGEIAV